MKKIFYQIEKGVVTGWTPGTDIFGDPSSTKAQMELWQAEDPGNRQVIILDPESETFRPVEAEKLKLVNGQIVLKTEKELADQETAKQEAEAAKEQVLTDLIASVKAKLMQGKPLTEGEADFLLHQRRDLFNG